MKHTHGTKLAALLLAAAMLCGALSGCEREWFKEGAAAYDVTVEGAVFAGGAGDAVETTVRFDPAWLTRGDNTDYNADLAAFAAILSADVYFRAKDLPKGTQNRVLYEGNDPEDYDLTAFLKEVGFTEAEYVETYKAGNYELDTGDSATFVMAHGEYDQKDVYAVALRGCFSAGEWISVYDPGYDGESYEALTGSHPEWTDRNAFKSFDIAKNRALTFLEDFMARTGDADKPDVILVTGHSRGGGLANLIGAELERRGEASCFTYTFSAPAVTTDPAAGEYATLFNILDENDFYADPLPFGEEHFLRYGRDLIQSIDGSPEIRETVAALKGRDDYACMTPETKAAFAGLFGGAFPDRASLYETRVMTSVFDTEEEAEAYAETCAGLMSADAGLDLADYMCPGAFPGDDPVSEKDGKYEVTLSYTGAAVLYAMAQSLAYGEQAFAAAKTLFSGDAAVTAMLDLLLANEAGIDGGHLLINGYAMTGFAEQAE